MLGTKHVGWVVVLALGLLGVAACGDDTPPASEPEPDAETESGLWRAEVHFGDLCHVPDDLFEKPLMWKVQWRLPVGHGAPVRTKFELWSRGETEPKVFGGGDPGDPFPQEGSLVLAVISRTPPGAPPSASKQRYLFNAVLSRGGVSAYMKPGMLSHGEPLGPLPPLFDRKMEDPVRRLFSGDGVLFPWKGKPIRMNEYMPFFAWGVRPLQPERSGPDAIPHETGRRYSFVAELIEICDWTLVGYVQFVEKE